MLTKPLYIFEDVNSTGINKVPLNALVMIQSDTNDNTITFIKKSNEGLDETSTIGDFMSNEDSFAINNPTTIIDGGIY